MRPNCRLYLCFTVETGLANVKAQVSMSGPTIRVLSLLELLQSHGRLSGTELAARLGVDKRTVRRYIQALEQLGIPVARLRKEL